MQYGELGYPNPYLRVLKSEPHCRVQAKDMWSSLLEKGYTYYWFRAGGTKDSEYRYCGVCSPSGQRLAGVEHAFETLTEALDYILDMEEQGALAG